MIDELLNIVIFLAMVFLVATLYLRAAYYRTWFDADHRKRGLDPDKVINEAFSDSKFWRFILR